MSYGTRARVAVAAFGHRIGAAGSAIASFGRRVGNMFTKAVTRLDRFLGVPKGEGIIEMMQGSPRRTTLSAVSPNDEIVVLRRRSTTVPQLPVVARANALISAIEQAVPPSPVVPRKLVLDSPGVGRARNVQTRMSTSFPVTPGKVVVDSYFVPGQWKNLGGGNYMT